MKTQLHQIAHRLNTTYPQGDNPFQIMTRLLEEAGELATEVNHQEKTGRKIEKLGPPNQEKLAGEITDVMQTLTQLIIYYDLEKEVDQILEKRAAQDCEIGGNAW